MGLVDVSSWIPCNEYPATTFWQRQQQSSMKKNGNHILDSRMRVAFIDVVCSCNYIDNAQIVSAPKFNGNVLSDFFFRSRSLSLSLFIFVFFHLLNIIGLCILSNTMKWMNDFMYESAWNQCTQSTHKNKYRLLFSRDWESEKCQRTRIKHDFFSSKRDGIKYKFLINHKPN